VETKARRCATRSRSTSTPASTSSSAIRTLPGSADPTRTPTGCCASTSPRAPTLFTVTGAELDAAADELNIRPRKRLAFANPTEQLAELPLQ